MEYLLWFAIAGGVPVIGIALVVLIGRSESSHPKTDVREKRSQRPPKRCIGSFIPDCRGCPFFSSPLFDPSEDDTCVGRCRYYGKELRAERPLQGRHEKRQN